jgi:hypothetical protein
VTVVLRLPIDVLNYNGDTVSIMGGRVAAGEQIGPDSVLRGRRHVASTNTLLPQQIAGRLDVRTRSGVGARAALLRSGRWAR